MNRNTNASSVRGGKASNNPRGGISSRGGIGAKGQRMNSITANKKFVKKFADKAHISSLLTQNKTFALQRLMRDYNEIKNSNFSLYGVSAAPLETNFFIWHGNLKALTQNIYKGSVIHLEIKFEEQYPIKPPKINVLNYNLKHPNIMPGGVLCLDMLEVSKEKFKGWTSGYTVLSILLQLQNFFFDAEDEFLKLEEKKEIAQSIKGINEFNCMQCAHKGSSNPWPEFTKNENQINILTLDKYKEEKKKEYVCFHRKTTFEETPLGLGITIAKIPRSGEIKGIVSRLDYISLKSYTKEKLRKDMYGQSFTHWFPIYFGIKQDQFLHLCKRSISLISTGSTRNFSPDQIFKIIPKFFLSLVTDIVSENVLNSSRSLKILIHTYRTILLLSEKYPEVLKDFESGVQKFIEDPASRHKDITSSLGDLLIYVTISRKHNLDELLPSYMQEQMDRQIFWMLEALPELEKLIESAAIDDVRAKVCFKSFIVGAQILLFFSYFNKKIIFKGLKSPEELSKTLDQNYGNITDEEIDIHQKEILKILKIDNFTDYHKFLGLNPLSDEEINAKIKQAYKNSAEKMYHGFDAVRYVPSQKIQLEKYLQKLPKLESLLTSDNKLLPEDDPIWEKSVMEKFDIVQVIKYNNPAVNFTPEYILKNYELIRRQNLFTTKLHNHEDYKRSVIDDFSEYNFKPEYEPDRLLAKLSWRQVYLKMFLELYLRNFNFIADFKFLYKLLEVCQDEIIHLNIDVHDHYNLKSDYHYLRAVLSKLNRLQYLCLNLFHKIHAENKVIKNLNKGLNNFKSASGSLIYLKLYTTEARNIRENNKNQTIWNILDKVPDIKLLDLSESPLDWLAAQKIRNHFYYFRSINTLILNNCSINDNTLKEICNGMMKAKGIENIYMSHNKITQISSLINNLAFQPTLKVMDISNNPITDKKELTNSLAKMLKMSQSIEVLILKHIPDMAASLDLEFYASLGESFSLKYLDISGSGIFNNYCYLGNAIAFNSLKKGSLKVLKIDESKSNYNNFIDFINGLGISEEVHNKFYGTNYNAEIMRETKEYYEAKFHNSLKFLGFSKNELSNHVNIHDLKCKNINHFKILLENSPYLEAIDFSETVNNKNFVEMMINALQGKNYVKFLNMETFLKNDLLKLFTNCFYMKDGSQNENIILEKLNLSKNDFGYSGIESISNILKFNKTLKTLNLYKNLFDVNGARRLSESLLENTTLEKLDIGYNRIKDLGFCKVVESIVQNKNSKLSHISVRCNFIKDEAALKNIDLITSNPTHLKHIELTNNNLTESTINILYNKLFSENKSSLNSDIFSICYYNSSERNERCVWISNFDNSVSKKDILNNINSIELELIIEKKSHLGIPLDIKISRGRNLISGKRTVGNQAFIEFIDPNSVNRILNVAATTGFNINGKRMKVFKAGSKLEKMLNKKRIR